jgi:hypothetical protein
MGAEHITFGDPDFFNGPSHAMAIVDALHAEFPALTYDVTIKIEHSPQTSRFAATPQTNGLPVCDLGRGIGERSNSRSVGQRAYKRGFRRSRAAYARRWIDAHPTFVAFTPWTTLRDFQQILETVLELDLVDNVAPIQLAIRLLIPAGSRLLELPELREKIGEFDSNALSYQWQHSDPALDKLCAEIQSLVQREEGRKSSRRAIFAQIWALAQIVPAAVEIRSASTSPIPHLSEPWYCCAEPTAEQLAQV